jgi:hypothetical protein
MYEYAEQGVRNDYMGGKETEGLITLKAYEIAVLKREAGK